MTETALFAWRRLARVAVFAAILAVATALAAPATRDVEWTYFVVAVAVAGPLFVLAYFIADWRVLRPGGSARNAWLFTAACALATVTAGPYLAVAMLWVLFGLAG